MNPIIVYKVALKTESFAWNLEPSLFSFLQDSELLYEVELPGPPQVLGLYGNSGGKCPLLSVPCTLPEGYSVHLHNALKV